MALPAPIATFCQVARRGWPVLAAALLTLLLGWAALHEGRGGAADGGLQTADNAATTFREGAAPGRLPAGEDALDLAICLTEAPADSEAGDAQDMPAGRCHGHWIAQVALWPADALRRHPTEPSLRLNPGHAPPSV